MAPPPFETMATMDSHSHYGHWTFRILHVLAPAQSRKDHAQGTTVFLNSSLHVPLQNKTKTNPHLSITQFNKPPSKNGRVWIPFEILATGGVTNNFEHSPHPLFRFLHLFFFAFSFRFFVLLFPFALKTCIDHGKWYFLESVGVFTLIHFFSFFFIPVLLLVPYFLQGMLDFFNTLTAWKIKKYFSFLKIKFFCMELL